MNDHMPIVCASRPAAVMAEEAVPTPAAAGAGRPEIDTGTWQGWADSIVYWAATEPYDFLFKVLLCLSPLFFISSLLSFKLAKALDKENKEKEKKDKMLASIAKKKKSKKAD